MDLGLLAIGWLRRAAQQGDGEIEGSLAVAGIGRGDEQFLGLFRLRSEGVPLGVDRDQPVAGGGIAIGRQLGRQRLGFGRIP